MTDTVPADEGVPDEGVAVVAADAAVGPASPATTSVAAATVMARRAVKGTPPQVTPYAGASGAVDPRWLLINAVHLLGETRTSVCSNWFGTPRDQLNGVGTASSAVSPHRGGTRFPRLRTWYRAASRR